MTERKYTVRYEKAFDARTENGSSESHPEYCAHGVFYIVKRSTIPSDLPHKDHARISWRLDELAQDLLCKGVRNDTILESVELSNVF